MRCLAHRVWCIRERGPSGFWSEWLGNGHFLKRGTGGRSIRSPGLGLRPENRQTSRERLVPGVSRAGRSQGEPCSGDRGLGHAPLARLTLARRPSWQTADQMLLRRTR